MAMSKYWEGCNVRPLRKIEDMTSMPREEFLRRCTTEIDRAGDEARKMGMDPTAARIRVIRRLAEGSLFFFTVYVIGGKDQFYNNDFVYRLCLDVQENKWGRLWVIAREHLKTTIITIISTIWEVCRNPKATFGVFSYKKPMAKKILSSIKKMIEGCPMLYTIWPDIFWKNPTQKFEIQPDGRKVGFYWSTESMQLRQSAGGMDSTFEAHGIGGSSATGSHFSHLILDDCETMDNVNTPEAIEKRHEEMTMAINTGKTADLNICLIGTFYAKEDAYSKLIKEGAVEEAIIQPCYDDDGTPIYYTAEILEQKRRRMGSLVVWATQMLCDPSMSSQNAFDERWLKYWDPDPENLDGLNIYLFVDPASDKVSRKHDYTVMIAAGINSLGQILILDILRDKMTFDDKFTWLMYMYKKWHPIYVYYEETAMASDTAHLTREMEKTNMFVPIIAYSPIGLGSKASRIEKLLFEFSVGNVYMPRACFHVNWKGVRENMAETCVKEELFGYPNVSHDDFMDDASAICIFKTNGKLVLPDKAFDPDARRHSSLGRRNGVLPTYDYDAMAEAVGQGAWDSYEY